MKKLTLRQIVLILTLIAVIIWVLIDRGVFSGMVSNGESVGGVFGIGGTDEGAALSAAASAARTSAPLEPLNWASDWGQDPFFYAQAETTEAGRVGLLGAITGTETPNLELGGISWRGNVGMALINGSVVQEGERIAGFQVTKIAYDHVILRRGTSIVRVSLSDE